MRNEKMRKAIKKATKALEASSNVKRGSNIMAVLRAEAEALGVAIRTKTSELSDAKIVLAETLRDRIVAKEICAHEGKDAKKANLLEANQYVRWAYPELKTVESASVRTSEVLTFALDNVVITKPDYRGAFKKWVEATPASARGKADYFGSCVKLNRLVEKEPTAKLTPAFFARAHVKREPAPKSEAAQKKADDKARQTARDSIIDAAKLLLADKNVHKDIKAQLRSVIAAISGKSGIA
jgi:hypothetical protein